MAKITYEDISKRLGVLKKGFAPWKPLLKDISDYVLPRRSFWDIDGEQGQTPAQKIYDGTGLNALQMLCDGMVGNVMSARLRWFVLGMEKKWIQDMPDVADYLEECEDILYAEFARSNFYEAISEFFLDAGSIGTAAMLVEDDVVENRVIFSTRHIKEWFIAEGRTGLVDTLYREYPITNRQAYQQWGDQLCQARLFQVKENPDGKAKIVHACYPRTDREYTKIDGTNKPWGSVYGDAEHKEIIDEGGFDQFPYLVWRWRKNTDELYGRSPAADALADILRSNQIAYTLLQSAHLFVRPPLNVPEKMRGLERIVPDGRNYFTDPKMVISPVQLGSNYPIGKDEQNQIREQIHEIFRSKIFKLLEQLEGSNKTAYEVREIVGEKAVMLNATLSRLNSEVLIPLIKRMYAICEKRDLLPPLPPALMAVGGRIHIEFKGPLAEAMKQYHESQGVMAATQFINVMREPFPESLDNVDGDELMRIGMDSQGAPQKTIREKPEVKKIRETRLQQQQQEKEEAIAMQEEAMIAQNANKLNEPVKPGSLMESIGKKAQKEVPK